MVKLTKINILISILFIGLLIGCEKELDYQLTNQIPQVVMYAFPMPDSTLKLHAGYTTNILSTNHFDKIFGLRHTVNINGEEKATGLYTAGKTWLSITNVIGESNDVYSVSYELKDGTIISGSTYIPEPIKIIGIDTISIPYTNTEGKEEQMLRCSIELRDPTGIKNYYQIRVDYEETSLTDPQSNYTETITFIKEDKVFLIRDDESVLLTDLDFQGTFTDHLFNGKSYKVKLLVPEKQTNKILPDVKVKLNIHLYTLTPEYYKFLRSTIEEEAFRDYPIFEPVNLFTNINNGIGVVAGLSVDTLSISLN